MPAVHTPRITKFCDKHGTTYACLFCAQEKAELPTATQTIKQTLTEKARLIFGEDIIEQDMWEDFCDAVADAVLKGEV
jgi:hypothetical protein